MTRMSWLAGIGCLAAFVGTAGNASAQWIVHDPTHYAQTVTTYHQLVEHYRLVLEQARRLPVDLARRYRVPMFPWSAHGVATVAQPMLDALNLGDASGLLYARTVAPLDALADAVAAIPVSLRPRVETGYATIELADQVARTAVHHAGTLRTQGGVVTRMIDTMEDDAVSGDPRFHSQIALLNKLNAAGVLQLRIADQTSQSVLAVVEQLLVANKRQRDAETKLMNAQFNQWRFGVVYGADLARNTAAALDGWRQP